ncbi:WRKY transcription factor 28 [Sesamum alatum]|uniref:WRKY transcription factor 28 n=1 Tax=Sesamum alatum TaxID=300844 RepID=A0AAE1XZH9_9LAMI|nr:WRKY transcription factor 28 [Sesamum alatum]
MSDEDKINYSHPYDRDHHNIMGSEGFPFSLPADLNFDPFTYNHHQLQNPTGFDHNHHSHMSFTSFLHGAAEYNTLSAAFDFSCSSSEAVNNSSSSKNLLEDALGTSNSVSENPPATPNSSVSFSSPEAGVEEDSSSKNRRDLQLKACEDGDHAMKSTKLKVKKKGEKVKQREQRFAFMTKSEVDNLEDGYRWRKYGQKAVKNSPFPRIFCNTLQQSDYIHFVIYQKLLQMHKPQKCNVKKRIERSFSNPSTVITTYEGQHNHHSPATLRGSAPCCRRSIPRLSQKLPLPGHHFSSKHQSSA